MAARHIRSSSTVSQHTRTASTSSEILITETVSSLQRCVFGNVFRSQRQLTRFGVCLGLLVFALYMLGPFGSSGKVTSDPKPKAQTAVRSVAEEPNPNSEYRATYFEEMGKRFAEKERRMKANSPFPSNVPAPEVKDEVAQAPDAQGELNAAAEKVREAARVVSTCKEVPGLSVVMVKGDHAVHVPVGLADVDAGRPVTAETKFLLNSVAVPMIGQLLGVLLSEPGRNVTWDTRVADILGPEFRLATEELTREVTLLDLLSHRSGLPSGNLAVLATYPEGWTRARLVKNLRHLPPSAHFRKTFLYSNMGAMLAVHVAETLGGDPWEKLMVDKLLTPLGMLGTRPLTSSKGLEGEDFSRLYVPVEGKVTKADSRIFDQGPLSPLALVGTSAKDVAKWLQFNLRRGKLEDGRSLIRPDVWLPLWTRQTGLSPHFLAGADKSGGEWPVKDVSLGYGLLWFINKYRGVTNFWHGGGLHTHHTLAWHFPERGVALYAVINGFSGDSRPLSVVESLAYYTADLLLGHRPWLDAASLCTFPWLSKNVTNARAADEVKGQEIVVRDERRVDDGNDDENEAPGNKGGAYGPGFIRFTAEGTAKLLEGYRAGTRPAEAYVGSYHSPLFGNFTFHNPETSNFQCRMNLLTGTLHQIGQGHTYGVQLTQSLRFLSKPSEKGPTSLPFSVTFLENDLGEVVALNVYNSWGMEMPLRFERIR